MANLKEGSESLDSIQAALDKAYILQTSMANQEYVEGTKALNHSSSELLKIKTDTSRSGKRVLGFLWRKKKIEMKIVPFQQAPPLTNSEPDRRYPAAPEGDYNFGERIGFILGLGGNNASDDIWEIPVIDPVTTHVKIDRAPRYRFNSAIGISYTFGGITNIMRQVFVNVDNYLVARWVPVRMPIGPTAAIFFSPSLLTNTNDISVAKSADLGIGFGWRTGPISFFVTGEFFRLPQPRQYFLDDYLDGNKTYAPGGTPATNIVLTDNAIFYDRWYVSLGFKICYTFDVFNSMGKAYPGLKAVD